jgi:hypothetical protein
VAVRAVRQEQDPERGKVSLGVRFEVDESPDDGKRPQELEFHRNGFKYWGVSEIKIDLVEIAWFAVHLMGTARQALSGWGMDRGRWERAATW